MLASHLKKLFSHPRLPAVAVVIACVLSLPARVKTRLVADDIWHRAMLLGDREWLPASPGPLSLFTFTSGTAEDSARIIENGFAAWWMSSGLRIAFFRPVASLTHVLDYALWPSSPPLMHAPSIAWYAVVVFLASKLHRRRLGPISPVAAGIATLFYAIDHTHGLPVGWIANRNTIVATAFALGALLLHDSAAKRERAGLLPYASALLLALALGSGEGATSTVFYLGAHALFLDERPLRTRALSLAPSTAVVFAWLVAYRVGHFGVIGSGVYHDPFHSPASFFADLLAHVPLLLGAELGAPTPDAWPFLPLGGKVVLLCLAAVVLAWAGRVFVRMARAADERVRRVSRFLLCAGYLSVLPGSAAFPSGRTLLLASFGLLGLLGMACAGLLEGAPWTRSSDGRPSRVVRAFAAWSWLGHLVLLRFSSSSACTTWSSSTTCSGGSQPVSLPTALRRTSGSSS